MLETLSMLFGHPSCGYCLHTTHTRTLGGCVFGCFWLPPLLGFLPSDDISHTGGYTHEVCPRIPSGIIVLKSGVWWGENTNRISSQ